MGVGCSHSIESGGFRKSFLSGVGSLHFIVIMGCSCIAQSSRAVSCLAWMAMGTWGSVPKPEKRKNGREWNRVDRQSQLSPSYPKIPSWPNVPSFVDTPKFPAWRNPLALGHGTAWDHYKMENFLHPTLKYPAAPKIPSSVDTTKYPAWSLFVDIPWLLGHRTAWDHYKMENHPKKYPAAPKIHSSVDTTKYPAWSLLSTGLGFWT